MDNTICWLEPVGPIVTSPSICLTPGNGILAFQTTQHDEITAAKNEIDTIKPASFWDDAKKITNPYEYVFLSLQKRNRWSLAAHVPLSRSYFKMIEMWDALAQAGLIVSGTPLPTAHTAEGPGGFLEAIQHRTGHRSRMTAMTLRSTDRAIPGWRKSQQFLISHPDVTVTYGADGTGDLYSMENQTVFATAAGKVRLYTADGGFDFSANFNGQENTVQRLLAAEILAGVNVLEQGGSMIIKLFDMKHVATLELFWALSSCFERTGLVKPYTSRPANSERYWIGVGFRGAPEWYTALLREMTTAKDVTDGWNTLFDGTRLSEGWLSNVRQFQETVEYHQLQNIRETISLIRAPTREKVQEFLLENIRCSRQWCIAHSIAINESYKNMSDISICAANLEEALVPFQASGAHMNLQALSPPLQMHRVLISVPSQLPPAGTAWRTALPASVLGRSPLNTVGDIHPSAPPPQRQSAHGSSRSPERT